MDKVSLIIPINGGEIRYSEDRVPLEGRRFYASYVYKCPEYEERINLFPYMTLYMNHSTEEIIEHLKRVVVNM